MNIDRIVVSAIGAVAVVVAGIAVDTAFGYRTEAVPSGLTAPHATHLAASSVTPDHRPGRPAAEGSVTLSKQATGTRDAGAQDEGGQTAGHEPLAAASDQPAPQPAPALGSADEGSEQGGSMKKEAETLPHFGEPERNLYGAERPEAKLEAYKEWAIAASGGESVIFAELRAWGDGSAGCPSPGMLYSQVIYDGALVVTQGPDGPRYWHGAHGVSMSGVPLDPDVAIWVRECRDTPS